MDDKSRIDIKMRNVFISWTGKDCALKDKIVERLVDGKITCTVSDGKSSDGMCAGNFVQWSANAAKSANVFLLILTENTLKSVYVPLEIKEFLDIDDAENRMVVVCPSLTLWKNAVFQYDDEKIKLSDRDISIIEIPNCVLTEEKLNSIYTETTSLINNRAYTVYQEEIKPRYIDVLSLYSDDAPDRKLSFDDLYINRQVTEKDETGQVVATHTTPSDLVTSDDIFYICGPAGSGKTQYIHQIQRCAGEDSVLITLSCSKVATATKSLRELMFDEFCRVLGNPVYFTEDNFVNLLNSKHLALVLDGLDEIATQVGVRTFVKKVEDEYYARHNASTTLFITGRDEKSAKRIALSDKPLRMLYLDRLTEQETQTLGNNLFLAFGSSDKSDGFFIRIKDLQDEIKYNPLLLSQLAVIYKENGDVPHTVVGIFDAISAITLKIDENKHYTNIPTRYMEMLEGMESLLKKFAQRRYILQSNDVTRSSQEIFEDILSEMYEDDFAERAAFLVEFLLKRSILVEDGNNFYHKMFLEYFTAVYYYERSIRMKAVKNYTYFNELFSHYNDTYWEQVITLFLIKADSLMNGAEIRNLYNEVLKAGNVTDYTLLLDTCANLVNNATDAKVATIADILKKSAEKIYPPYGPLFWYVPTYSLYEETLLALETLGDNAEALALTRDVCYIYGQKNSVAQITDKVNGLKLFNGVTKLTGVRKALCEIFYLGNTQFTAGSDIYPRCFNVAETLSFRDNSCGVGGQMPKPFNDELGLYSHESYNELNGEYMGFISCPYDFDKVEQTLRAKATRRVTGIAYSPTSDFKFINRTSNILDKLIYHEKLIEFVHPQFFNQTCVCYYPENLNVYLTSKHTLNYKTQLFSVSVGYYGVLYLYGDVTFPFSDAPCVRQGMFTWCHRLNSIKLPSGITCIENCAFEQSGLSEISLPDSLTTLDDGAFRHCENLTSIIIPDKTTQLNDGVFDGCYNLHTVVLPQQLQKIGKRCFGDCVSLNNISIPDAVTEIGQEAFGRCKSLVKIQIPNGIHEIKQNTFNDCTNLEIVDLPQSIISIDECAFFLCSKLTDIKASNTLMIGAKAFFRCRALQHIDIDAVTVIGKDAFCECVNLSELTLPDTMTDIGEGAFAYCGFSSIVFPHGIRKINNNILEHCENLQKVSIPDTVTEIGDYAFYSCTTLESVNLPSCITRIGRWAFKDCLNLNSIDIKEGLRAIAESAFHCCYSLQEIYLPDSVTELEGCLGYCEHLVKVRLPNGLTKIPDAMFEVCEELKEIEIPDSVTEISRSAFDNCISLESINIPLSLHKLGEMAFSNCKSLKEIKIPDTIEEILPYTFKNCVDLQSIDISSVCSIGKFAFSGCQSLQNVQLGNRLATIEAYAFKGCSQLKRVEIPGSAHVVYYNAFEDCVNLKEITVPLELQTEMNYWLLPNDCQINFTKGQHATLELPYGITEVTRDMVVNRNVTQVILPESVICIGDDAFRDCEFLTDVNIPHGVKRIGNFAFYNCSSIEKLSLNDEITTIGNSAFAECRGLQEIYIPDSVVEIGERAFSTCYSLSKVRLSNNIKVISASVFESCSSLSDITLPEGITEIGSRAFYSCKLEKLILPSTVTKIGANAFANCPISQSVIIPQGVTELSEYMFCGCAKLPQIIIPESVKVIGNNVFNWCENLKEIYVPDSVTELGSIDNNFGSFRNSGVQKLRLSQSLTVIPAGTCDSCRNLTEIDVPSGVELIDWCAFSHCTNLQTVHLPDTLQSIQDGAFEYCTSLKEIFIPDSVTELGSSMSHNRKNTLLYVNPYATKFEVGVFERCENLKKVRLPNGLPYIDRKTFYGCVNLSEIEIPASVMHIDSRAFKYCFNLKHLTIPISVISIADDAFEDTNLDELTISRNFENDIDRIFGKNRPQKIKYI